MISSPVLVLLGVAAAAVVLLLVVGLLAALAGRADRGLPAEADEDLATDLLGDAPRERRGAGRG